MQSGSSSCEDHKYTNMLTMNTRITIIILLITGVFSQCCLGGEADDRLDALFAREWEWTMREFPEWASYLGDRRWNDEWDRVGVSDALQRGEHWRAVLDELAGFDEAELSEESRLNLALYRRSLREAVEGVGFGSHLLAINQRRGIQTVDDFSRSLRFDRVSDYEDWIARLRGFSSYMDETIGLMREGMRRGVVQPRVIMERVPRQIERQIVDDAAASGFYGPFVEMNGVDEGEAARLRGEARAAINDVVVPAYRGLLRFVEDEYLPASLDGVGAWRWPNGEAMYGAAVGMFTTTQMSADEIHELGLSEVARIRGEMQRVRDEVGFEGDLDAFFAFMRDDERFYYESGEALLAGYRARAKEIDPLIVPLFGKLPRAPYGITPIPEAIAPDTTTAYYQHPAADGSRAGMFFVNLYRPDRRPKWEMTALTLHEAVPGHHLQLALQQELGEVPEFRKQEGYTAFIEGWGLYAESLGYEMGLYDDPYDRFGALTYEMWRACRLVVDTGIHSKRWTRQRAVDFMMSNTARAELDVVNEVDRYISWPGQALAYKIGELKIKELRARAADALGDGFDVAGFHDVVLGAGAVPLDVLEQRVDVWVAERRAAGVE